ncbi:MAG TPA: lysylphosphatidylglycerol synthase transmembrane domain-containing protein [Myxococcales bacterium]
MRSGSQIRGVLARSWRPLSLAVGVAVFAYLLHRVGIRTIVDNLAHIGPAFLLMPATSISGLCVRGLAILPLMPRDARFGIGAAIASRLAATALNMTIPAFGVGGEAVRLLWVPSEKRQETVSAIILDNALLVLADLVFLLLAVAAAVFWLALPRRLEWLALGVALLSVVLATGLVWLTARLGVSVPFVRALRLVGFKSMAGKVPDARAVDESLRALWRDRPICVLQATALQFASRLFLAGEIWVGLWLLNVPASPVEALIVSAAPIGANALFTFIPAQLGVQEGSLGLMFGLVGLDGQTGLVLGLVQRVAQLMQIPVGLVALVLAPRRRRPASGARRPARDFG